MLFRVSGKLVDGNAFATRVDAASAIEAVAKCKSLLNNAETPVTDDQIAQITSGAMKEKPGAIFIGAARTRKSKSVAANGATAPAASAAPNVGKAKTK